MADALTPNEDSLSVEETPEDIKVTLDRLKRDIDDLKRIITVDSNSSSLNLLIQEVYRRTYFYMREIKSDTAKIWKRYSFRGKGIFFNSKYYNNLREERKWAYASGDVPYPVKYRDILDCCADVPLSRKLESLVPDNKGSIKHAIHRDIFKFLKECHDISSVDFMVWTRLSDTYGHDDLQFLAGKAHKKEWNKMDFRYYSPSERESLEKLRHVLFDNEQERGEVSPDENDSNSDS